MARLRPDQPLVPSVLDRLLDYEPSVHREAPRTRNQVLRELKQSVRRDLENLLNTRVRCTTLPPGLPELEVSLVNYGLPDFTTLNMGAVEARERLPQIIERVIRAYDSRFKTIRVQMLTNAEPVDRTLRFRIDGVLHAEPAPEPVMFDSTLETATGSFEVKGAV